MMNNTIDKDKMWKLILESLQVSMVPSVFGSWISPLKIESINEAGPNRSILTVGCPSQFHSSIIDQRYYGQIIEAAEQILNRRVEVKLNISEEIKSESSSDVGPLFSREDINKDQLLKIEGLGISRDNSFESFAVSPSNAMAHAAAETIAKSLGKAYNPLLLYGGVGVGKTHLMQAIALSSFKKNLRLRMIYSAGEEFTNEIIEAIQRRNTPKFRRRYREVGLLMIDDIQFIAGKKTVQEEFFHTFNAILKNGGQVVMTSDRPPHEISLLEDRLRSRFQAGLIVDIGEPNFELRTAITIIKAGQKNIPLDIEGAKVVAANIESARQIEGFLVRLTSESKLKNQPINAEFVESVIGKSVTKPLSTPPPLRPSELTKGVARYFELTLKQIRGKGRSRYLVGPRHIAMYLLRIDYNLPLTDIGDYFSGRDHTTVMHAVEKITRNLQESDSLRIDVTKVRKSLYGY